MMTIICRAGPEILEAAAPDSTFKRTVPQQTTNASAGVTA
jgi:hypothetical protein